jgi:hypothetical protein
MIKSKRMSWTGHVAHMGEMRNLYKIFVRKPEGKGPLGRLRRRWENNIKIDLKETECEGVEWNHLAQDGAQWRAVVMNLRVP